MPRKDRKKSDRDPIRNAETSSPDPITGAEAHPTGTGVGALGGATAGAAMGALAGPAGAVAGSIVGAALGGLAGRKLAGKIDRAVEEQYWREHYRRRPYVREGADFEVYRPAYEYGWDSYARHGGGAWSEHETVLVAGWERGGHGDLTWNEARPAVQDAWERLERTIGEANMKLKDKDKDKDLETGKADGEPDANRDPISGAKGAHPVGVGLGASGGGAAGAAIGSVAGPVGAAIGGAVGAVAGGLAGKGLAESVNPTVEDDYWRENYRTRPYIEKGADYEAYRPAYRYGWESYGRLGERRFEEVEPELSREWEGRGGNDLGWQKARPAVRDAWDRLDSSLDRKR